MQKRNRGDGGQAGALPSGIRDGVDDAVGFLCQRDESRDHGLHWEGLTFAEAYNRGRFEVCFPFGGARTLGGPSRAPVALGTGHVDVELDATSHDEVHPFLGSVRHFGHGFTELREGHADIRASGNDKPVLIGYVQGVDSVELFVPARIRLEVVDFLDDLFAGEVYLSCLNGSTKTLRRFAEWKLDRAPLSGCFAFIANHLKDEQIEGGSQVVDGIANDQGDCIWHGYLGFDRVGNLAGLAVKATKNSQGMLGRVGINLPVEVDDVMLGPLNL